jgi:hypothetical protein
LIEKSSLSLRCSSSSPSSPPHPSRTPRVFPHLSDFTFRRLLTTPRASRDDLRDSFGVSRNEFTNRGDDIVPNARGDRVGSGIVFRDTLPDSCQESLPSHPIFIAASLIS